MVYSLWLRYGWTPVGWRRCVGEPLQHGTWNMTTLRLGKMLNRCLAPGRALYQFCCTCSPEGLQRKTGSACTSCVCQVGRCKQGPAKKVGTGLCYSCTVGPLEVFYIAWYGNFMSKIIYHGLSWYVHCHVHCPLCFDVFVPPWAWDCHSWTSAEFHRPMPGGTPAISCQMFSRCHPGSRNFKRS